MGHSTESGNRNGQATPDHVTRSISRTEKGLPVTETTVAPTRGLLHPIQSVKTFGIAVLATCAILVWLLASCVPAIEWESDTSSFANFGLVKDAVAVPVASATPAVLEVFQVYQPVLTPSGITAQTIAGDGSANTTTILPTAASDSCKVLLMEYSFGYSYGKPFVGNFLPHPSSD